jgi:hypothetical protein
MKKWVWLTGATIFFLSCQKDTDNDLLHFKGVEENDMPPVASFNMYPNTGCLGDWYPGVQVNLVSTATDDGNNIKEYKWRINGMEYTGQNLSITLLQEGANEIVHIVKDKTNDPVALSKTVTIQPFPRRIKVRLTGVYTSPAIGDGVGEQGEIFFVIHSLREKEPGQLEMTSQKVYPEGAPETYTFELMPNTFTNFTNRGIILYEGDFKDRWAASFVGLEYDPAQGCTICDILGTALPAAGLLLEPFVPGSKTVGSVAGEVSNLIGEYVSSDARTTVISHIELEHGPEDVWQYGCKKYANFGALAIEYIVEPIP